MRPHVIKAPEPSLVFSSGDTIRLACVFGGRPRPEIRWSRRNGEIAPSRSYTLEAQVRYFHFNLEINTG